MLREKLKTARKIIEDALALSQSPVCMVSFGKESILLLALLRHYSDVAIIWYRTDDLTREQKQFAHQVIRDWNLTVFSYAPSDRYFLPNDKGLTLINEYSIGGQPFPVLQDIEHSDKCGLEISKERTPYFPYAWGVTFWGNKAVDTHPLVSVKPPASFDFGSTKFYAPLWDFTDDEVWRLIRRLNVPYDKQRYEQNGAHADEMRVCTRCFNSPTPTVFCPEAQKEVPVFAWDGAQAVRAFKERLRL